jgi:D-glycero-D-manno-heptose 1,7-bisphosphate phosphatase
MSQHRHRLLPPLPGTGLPARGLFVSRTGVLLERSENGFVRRFEDARFVARSLELLFRAGQAGWNLYVIGNEDAVAHGKLADAAWSTFETAFLEHLRGHGVVVKRHYACIDHPEGKPPHRRDSVFRFPNTGALYHAAQEDGIDLGESWIVSDDVLEQAAGWRVGMKVAAIERADHNRRGELQTEASIQSASPAAALIEILGRERLPL